MEAMYARPERNDLKRPGLTVVLLVAVALSPPLHAQSMTVIGGNSFARECYMSATIAAQSGSGASLQDVRSCTDALSYGNLSLRDRTATFVNRGILYVAMGDYASGKADYDTATRLSPETGEVYVNRGNLLFLRKNYSEAVDEYSRALSVGLSKDHIAHYNRGMAYEKMGDISNAESDYRRAMELVPEWYLPQARLDQMLARTQAGRRD